jgi:hypothetical protein
MHDPVDGCAMNNKVTIEDRSYTITSAPLMRPEAFQANRATYDELAAFRASLGVLLEELFPHKGPFWTTMAIDSAGKKYMTVIDIRTRRCKLVDSDRKITDASETCKDISEETWQSIRMRANAIGRACDIGPDGLIPEQGAGDFSRTAWS